MLCEKCGKKTATFFYNENLNGNKKSYSLCDECAKELKSSGDLGEINMDSFFGESVKSINSLFETFFTPSGVGHIIGGPEKKCPVCSSTIREIYKNGKVGCGKCYGVFEGELAGAIRNMHGHTTHCGRTPRNFREKKEIKDKIELFEKERIDAIENENYERAAEIRDQLKKLRENI